MICKNCGQGVHLHWTGGWIHDERTPSGNYLYCGIKAEPSGRVSPSE